MDKYMSGQVRRLLQKAGHCTAYLSAALVPFSIPTSDILFERSAPTAKSTGPAALILSVFQAELRILSPQNDFKIFSEKQRQLSDINVPVRQVMSAVLHFLFRLCVVLFSY
jgi:hypothetical protein